MDGIHMRYGAEIVREIAAAIEANAAYLSDIDGKIGDGDHGVNMNKGFTRAAALLDGTENFEHALQTVSDILMNEIGGSMGPLYGLMFAAMADSAQMPNYMSVSHFSRMLHAGLEAVTAVGGAQLGDKTMVDTLAPAVEGLENAVARDMDFATALTEMKNYARAGRDSTINMEAKLGRASRLGARSRGVMDAGASSCYIILETLADSVIGRLESL